MDGHSGPVICANPRCVKPSKRKGAYGWCHNCTARWYNHGRPEGGPPDPQPHDITLALAELHAAKEWRIEQYIFGRDFLGFSKKEAAADAGISHRNTIARYEAIRIARGEQERINASRIRTRAG